MTAVYCSHVSLRSIKLTMLVFGLETHGDRLVIKARDIKTMSDRDLVVDGAVAGIGIQPNVELAWAAGLKVSNGILVDKLLRMNYPDIYAVGEVAAFYNPLLQIADTLQTMLYPYGVAVYLEAHHLCMEMRGVRETASLTRTTF
jgi:NAD(P)H-nitrite reductase large subunit